MTDIYVSPLAKMAIRLYGTGAILFGVLQIIGGPERWASPAYATLNLFPGAPYTLAVVSIVLGIIIMVGSLLKKTMLRNIGLYAFAFWLMFYAVCFFTAVFASPAASLTVWFFYALMATHVFVLAKSKEEAPHGE